jgi:Uma2 family endonuclease
MHHMSLVSALEIPRKIWTREEARLLVELGFPNAEKLELIDGELIQRMGKKQPHMLWQNLLQGCLQSIFGREYVQMEPSIHVSAEDDRLNEPEPDLIVTTRSVREFKDNPTPADIRLLIEIADTTVNYDLGKKARLYARAGIPDYWVVDIPDRLTHVHRVPKQDAFTSVVRYRFDESIAALAGPDSLICLERL